MSYTTPEQAKARKALAVKNAVASSLLEGIKPTTHAMNNLKKYASGQASVDTLIAEAKRRYARG